MARNGDHPILPAKREQEHRNDEVSLAAGFDGSKLTISAKGRLFSALDALGAATIGVWSARREAKRRIAEIELSTDVLRAEMKHRLSALRLQDEYDQMVLERAFAMEERKLTNVHSVIEQAAEAVRALPPPQRPDVEEGASELDGDWLGMFTGCAERATSEHMQKLLGLVLAGEIRRPGAFSLSTLRIASEIDYEVAIAFKDRVASRFANDKVVRPQIPAGEPVPPWGLLADAGLVHGTNVGLTMLTVNIESGGVHRIETDNWFLEIRPKADLRLMLSVFQLTRAGRELALLLPSDEVETLRWIASTIGGEVGLSLGTFVEDFDNGGRAAEIVETLRAVRSNAAV
jgi:Protein of unknown function (DUF2806)